MKKVVFILLSFVSISYSQGIRELKLLDGYSLPLAYGDDGISFQYITTSSGQLSAYLKTDYDDFKIFSDRQEFKGLGFINISASTLLTLFKHKYSFYSNISLLLSHISSRTSHHSSKELPLKIEIEKPYGFELEEYPNKPNLYSTDYTKNVIQPLPVVGLASGSCLVIAGLVIELSNQKDGEAIDEEKQKSAHTMMAIGAALLLLSCRYLNKGVPDTERNDQNQIRNDELLDNWKKEYNRIDQSNQLIRATFKIRFSIL